MHFMLYPPISVQGTTTRELNLPGIETLKSFSVTPEKVSFTINSDDSQQTVDIITFNSPVKDVNIRISPDDNNPLELMPMATV